MTEKTANALFSPAVSHGRLSVDEPWLHDELTHPWEVYCTPLDAGEFGYHLRYLTTPNIVIYEESFDLACRVRGLTPGDCFTFSIPLRLGARSAYWNQPPEQTNLIAGMPCGLDVVVESGQRHLIVLIRLSLLQLYFREEEIAGLKRATAKHLLQTDPARARRLARWLLAQMENSARVSGYLKTSWAHNVEMELIDQLLSISEEQQGQQGNHALSKQTKSLDRAIACIRETRPRRLNVADLCLASENSRRTLEYAFRDAFDLGPRQFLHRLKLHSAHRRLKLAEHGETTVARIAQEEGFLEMGRFSIDYRKLFGESPSETLRQSQPLPASFPFKKEACAQHVDLT